jgi:hypothetical protein
VEACLIQHRCDRVDVGDFAVDDFENPRAHSSTRSPSPR